MALGAAAAPGAGWHGGGGGTFILIDGGCAGGCGICFRKAPGIAAPTLQKHGGRTGGGGGTSQPPVDLAAAPRGVSNGVAGMNSHGCETGEQSEEVNDCKLRGVSTGVLSCCSLTPVDASSLHESASFSTSKIMDQCALRAIGVVGHEITSRSVKNASTDGDLSLAPSIESMKVFLTKMGKFASNSCSGTVKGVSPRPLLLILREDEDTLASAPRQGNTAEELYILNKKRG